MDADASIDRELLLLAFLDAAVDTLRDLNADPRLDGLGRGDLVERIARLDAIANLLRDVRPAHDEALANLMEADDETIGGYEVGRTRSWRDVWQSHVVEDGRRAVLLRLAVNEVTGEVDEDRYRQLAAGWDAAADCFRMSGDNLRLTPFDKRGFNPRDYRTRAPGPWRIHLVAAPPGS